MPTEPTIIDRPDLTRPGPMRRAVRDALEQTSRESSRRRRPHSAPHATRTSPATSTTERPQRRNRVVRGNATFPFISPDHGRTQIDSDTTAPRRGFSRTVTGPKVRLVQSVSCAISSSWFGLVLALAVAYGVSSWRAIPTDALLPFLGILAVVRIACPWFYRTHTVLQSRRLPIHLHELLLDELLITLAGTALVFLIQVPVSPVIVLAATAGTVAMRTMLYGANRVMQGKLVRWNYHTDSERFSRRVLVIGTGRRAKAITDAIIETPELDTQVIGFLGFGRTGFWRYRDLPLVGAVAETQNFLATLQVDALIIAVESEELPRTVSVFQTAEQMGVPIYTPVDPYQPTNATSRLASLNGYPLVAYSSKPRSAVATIAKTVMDRVGAALALLFCLPLLSALALAIKLDSPGPVLFRQIRMGLNGRRFALYKLRTMTLDAERRRASLAHRNEMSGPVFKIKNDPRITRVGKFLRKFSLDELPQFFNVLRGDMSLVGPRPALPTEVARFEPWQRRKLSVLPGLTCLWQIGGRNAIDFENWMKLDLQYIDTWSLWLDIKILFKTIPAVLKGSGS